MVDLSLLLCEALSFASLASRTSKFIMANPDSARRNLVRFSLRTLLVLTAISAVLCGWLGIQYANCQRESAIVAELAAAGISVKSP